MQKFNQPVRQLLNRAQRRFVRSRPGSVLILVVALLILMAIIGTAFMSMAQADRSTAVIHSNNTEVDLLIDGLVNVVKGTIANDLFGQSITINNVPQTDYRAVYRYNTGETGTYNYLTALGDSTATDSAGTTFVASRTPEIPGETGGFTPNAPFLNYVPNINNPPFWRYISSPLFGGQFSTPVPPVHLNNLRSFLLNEVYQNPPYSYSQRNTLSPLQAYNTPTDGAIQGNPLYPGAMPGTGMPAWIDNPINPQRFFPAADADGDGIADSGYVKLPMGAVNGVTYYAAVRIVDNNAAVNASTAWEHNPITTGYTPPQLPGDFFSSNIDLFDLLDINDLAQGFNNLVRYRLGNNPLQPTAPVTVGTPFEDDTAKNYPARFDFWYPTLMEAQFMGLNRRLKNPSFCTENPSYPFIYLSVNEALTMARNYVMRDAILGPNQTSSLVELDLQRSAGFFSTASTTTYNATDSLQWYDSNFNQLGAFSVNAQYRSVRPILTSQNAVSEFVPSKFRDISSFTGPPPGGLRFGDSVLYQGHRYVCINPFRTVAVLPGVGAAARLNPATTPPDQISKSASWALDNDMWVYEPWTNNPTKTSINTATFGQLMLGFWSVMAEKQLITSNPVLPSNSEGRWEPAFPVTPNSLLSGDPARMFRSPLRVPIGVKNAGWRLTPSQVMQLRAAIAAVNTIDLRDSDDDVTSRTVHLTDPTHPVAQMQDVIATVFGNERQPFIVKVYATNEPNNSDPANPQPGYIAIELFNPDTTRDMSLSGWALGTINKFPTTVTPIPLTLPDATPTIVPFAPDPAWYDAPGIVAPVIPKYDPAVPGSGYIVIASSATPPPGITLPPTVQPVDPQGKPVGTGIPLYVVHNLVPVQVAGFVGGGPWGALGNELMLFKPRRTNPASLTGAGMPTCWSGGTAPGTTTGPTPLYPTTAGDLANATPWPYYHEGTVLGPLYTPNLADMVPIDSYDFSGLNTMANPAGTPTEWYYFRPNSAAAQKSWHYVYPGHFVFGNDGYVPAGGGPPTGGPPFPPRLFDGTWDSDDPNALNHGIGQALFAAGIANGQIPFDDLGVLTARAQYVDIPIRLNSTDFPSANTRRLSDTSGIGIGYPFGGFARNGDIMDVPFIGSYRLAVLNPPGANPSGTLQIIEMNPITMDSVMALGMAQPQWGETEPVFTGVAALANGDPVVEGGGAISLNPNYVENVGRFCPIGSLDFRAAANGAPVPNTPNDYEAAPPPPPPPIPPVFNHWMYHFGTHLLDYLTVQSPQADYTPDVDPALNDQAQDTTTGATLLPTLLKFRTGVSTGPFPVPNTPGIFNGEPSNTNNATEETAPKYGLVNINTAPWRVLSAIPWVPADYPNVGSGTVYPSRDNQDPRVRMNINIALSIVRYRDVDDGASAATGVIRGHGPFKSVDELLYVPVYNFLAPPPPLARGQGTLLRDLFLPATPGPVAYNVNYGVLSPSYPGNGAPPPVNAVYNDFQTKYIMMNRISNLVTTRSDSFTAYVLIEGWQDPETSQAKRVVSRRTSFLIDRTGVTPISRDPTVTFIPSNQ